MASRSVELTVRDRTEDELVTRLIAEHDRAYRAAWLVLRV